MADYNKFTWTEDTPITAERLNNLEEGISYAYSFTKAGTDLPTPNTFAWRNGSGDTSFNAVNANVANIGRLYMTDYSQPLEIGKYIDFHEPNSVKDCDGRLLLYGDSMAFSTGDDLSKTIRMGVGPTDRYFYNNTSNKYFTLKDNGQLQYDSRQIPTLVSANGYLGFADSTGNDNMWLRAPKTGILPYQSGGSGALGSPAWRWGEAYFTNINTNAIYTDSSVGYCVPYAGGNGDGISYGSNNMFTRCHYGWGIQDNNGLTNMVIDSRAGRVIGKSAYWHNSNRELKSDIRALASECLPMAINLKEGEQVDTNLTIEDVLDFLANINIRTYVSDFRGEGVKQEEADVTKGNILQLGYTADEMAEHKAFKYFGEEMGDGLHAINTTALTTALITAYQAQLVINANLEDKVNSLEERLAKLEAIITK